MTGHPDLQRILKDAVQLTVQDDMYYNHGLLMNKRIDIHPKMTGHPDLQRILKDTVVKVFTAHGIRGVEIVENRRRDYVRIFQGVIKQLDSIRQSKDMKTGETPPSVEHEILPTPIFR